MENTAIILSNDFIQESLSVDAIDRYVDQDLGIDIAGAIRERYKELLLDLLFKKQRLKDIPVFFRRPIACILGLMNFPEDIQFVPKESLSADMVTYFVRKFPPKNLFAIIPDENKTKEICIAALNADTMNLHYVPEKFLTTELCYNLVKKRPNAFRYVPIGLISEEITEFIFSIWQKKGFIAFDYNHEWAVIQRFMGNIPRYNEFEAYVHLGDEYIAKVLVPTGYRRGYHLKTGQIVCEKVQILEILKNGKRKKKYGKSSGFKIVIWDALCSKDEYCHAYEEWSSSKDYIPRKQSLCISREESMIPFCIDQQQAIFLPPLNRGSIEIDNHGSIFKPCVPRFYKIL